MRVLRSLAVASVAALATLPLASARAQRTFLGGGNVVTPYIGVYMPSNDIARMSLSSGGASADAQLKHQSSPIVGATVSHWLNDRIAIEGGLAYTSSDIKGSRSSIENGTSSSQLLSQHANIWLANTKLMLQVLPPESNFNLRFGVGPAVITRSGTAYHEDVGKDVGLTDVGAAMSLCTRFNFTPNVGLRLRVEDFIYRAKLGYENPVNPSENYSFRARTQHDFVFSAGLQLFLNR